MYKEAGDDIEDGMTPIGTYDSFMAEGLRLKDRGEWLKAAYYMKRALNLKDNEQNALLQRSYCLLRSGNEDKAMQDVDKFLKVSVPTVKGYLRKADTFYSIGKFEGALVYYHRGRHMSNYCTTCKLGIQKCEGSINGAVGNSKMLLNKRGDLSFFQKQIELDQLEKMSKKPYAMQPIKKKIKKEESYERPTIRDLSKDQKIVKILGRIYADRCYMERIYNDISMPMELGKGVSEESYSAILFMDKQADKWRQEYKGKLVMRRNKLHSIATERSRINMEVTKELTRIDLEQSEENYEQSLLRARELLNRVSSFNPGVIKKREEIQVTIHCYIGNAYLEMNNLKMALDHFKMMKAGAIRHGIVAAKLRALDNMGRTFGKMGAYKKAINIWNVKLPLATKPEERGWVLHELASCHYKLENYTRAKDLAVRALKEAELTSDLVCQLNAMIIIAQSLVRLYILDEALQTYLTALQLANSIGEENVIKAIERAIDELNKMRVLLSTEEKIEEEEDLLDETVNIALQTDATHADDQDIYEDKFLQYLPVCPDVTEKEDFIETSEIFDVKHVPKQAYVTLVTNDTYALGAMVLGFTLRASNTTRKLVVMVTSEVSKMMRDLLAVMYDLLFDVWVIDSKDFTNLNLLQRTELGITFTKIHAWRLIQFDKCVFMDADTMVLRDIDDLFLRPELSAAPDAGWPDCFNSGVFVYVPSLETFNKLLKFAEQHGSFDGGDQGLLNMYFADWATDNIERHLSFTYNLVWQAFYSYQPAYKKFGQDAKVVHFIGPLKPWTFMWDSSLNRICHVVQTIQNKELLQLWWDIFMSKIQPMLSKDMCGLIGQLAKLKIRAVTDFTNEELADRQRQYNWERNQIDYMGTDCFENIKNKLDNIIRSELPEATTKIRCVEKPQLPKGVSKRPCY